MRVLLIWVAALWSGALGAAQAQEALPSACAVLQALEGDAALGPDLTYQTLQDRQSGDLRMSLCNALGEDDLPRATLMLREDGSNAVPRAEAQRDALLSDLSETFGQAPEARFPEIGEAAVWVADIGQLTVWYRDGRVMLIVTSADQDGAERIARGILAAFP